MFTALGKLIGRWPWFFVGVWGIVLASGVVWALLASDTPPADIGSFLPYDSLHNQAVRLIQQAFPKMAARSQIVVIAERPTALTDDDFTWLHMLSQAAGRATEGRTLSPAVDFLKPRLLSQDKQSAMMVVNLSSNFISPKSIEAVKAVERMITADPAPADLTVEITGTAGIGRDYADATEQALHNTTWVTIFAVLIILIVIYRSPIGALVPLVSIGASVYLAFVLLALLSRAGWEISNMDRVFAVVLLFGAGVDYALFWISRYRETLHENVDFIPAAQSATRHSGPAIMASAGTTICGLTTMLATDLVPTQNAGKVLAAVLIVALLAALTLSPALARGLRRGLLWPLRPQAQPSIGQRYFWPLLADRVTRRPGTVMLAGTILLAVLALLSLRINFRFDSLSELPEGSSSQRGYEIARRHFSKGQLYSNTLLLKFDRQSASSDELEIIGRALTKSIADVNGVYDVYSLDAPLGQAKGKRSAVIGSILSLMSHEFYQAKTMPILRFEILIDHLPFSFEAMDIIEKVRTIANETTNQLLPTGQKADVFLAGPTPYVIAVRKVAGKDQLRVMVLATTVIALIVLVLIRDLPLTVFMLLATWLTYGATLTLSQFFFVEVLNEPGLDLKVRLIVFVIVVAVGQDYNIFLVTRLLEEPAEISDAQAARRAIVSTGSVISSCGLIMAATLGSLWAGGLLLLQQVGFALALGILIDTFFVRPLLIPSFYLATGRRRKSRPNRQESQNL
ncbi:MAG: MMPL family transporter [Planctomycetota bacterium]|nr:MAG: MMPL family transporter [Planctomycetota bacterium]